MRTTTTSPVRISVVIPTLEEESAIASGAGAEDSPQRRGSGLMR